MLVLNWSGPGEIKELHCGAKTPTIQCVLMGCTQEYWDSCGMQYTCNTEYAGYGEPKH